jgi:hypothetical protein
MNDAYHYEKLVILNNVYQNTFIDDDTSSFHKSSLIMSELYPHQKTMIQGMMRYRETMTRGVLIDQRAINGKLGIIGDPHGSGKTLSVLSYIAATLAVPYLPMTNELSDYSTRYFFSHDMRHISDKNVSNLIIVPHSLFNQWKEEIKIHTMMTYVPIETKRMIKENETLAKITASAFVLTTNKCYRYVQEYANRNGIQWNNVFIDEAASIYFHPADPALSFQFLWLMTSQWPSLLFKNPTIHSLQLYALKEHVNLHEELGAWLLDPTHEHYDYPLISSAYLKEYIPFQHPQRGLLVLRNSTTFLRESMKLYPMNDQTISCKPNITIQSITSYFLSRNPPITFGSSHIPYLFQALGVDFMSYDQYVDQQPTAKKTLIQHKLKEKECLICFDPCEYTTIVNCCYNTYCGKCILKNMIMNPPKCPTCRETVLIPNMTCIETLTQEDRMLSKSKMEVCLDLFRKNRDGQFIIYSSFENIYFQMFEEMDRMGIKAERIEDNLFSLIKVLRNFKEGTTQVIFLSDVKLIRGLSFSSISHLIFYHELPSSELKEVLIHSAQRLNRKNPLQILHLNSEIQV